MKKKWIVNTINIAVFILLITVVWWLSYGKAWIEKRSADETPVAVYETIEYSGWLVDWEWDESLLEASALLDKLSSIQLFVGYFDEAGSFIWDEQQEQMVEQVKQKQLELKQTQKTNNDPDLYFTVVNDVIYKNGTTEPKSNELVTNIIQSNNKQEQLIEQWVSILKKHNLTGMELDFENMSDEVWEQYLPFVRKLFIRLHDEQLKLKVVIEAKTPIHKLDWPEGPQYVVTAYNLFGLHSGPGAKADKSFIGKLAAKMEVLPGKPAVAIATGGFLWKDGANAIAIREKDIAQYVPHDANLLKRDEQSQALSYQYEKDGSEYELWYADDMTLNYWITEIQQRGYSDIAIWRFGNNNIETLEKVIK